MMRARSFLAVVLLSLGSTASLCAYVTGAALPNTERIAILDNSAKSLYPAENPWLNPESRNGLLCHNDPVNKTDPFGLDPGPERDFLVGFDNAATGGIATGIMNAFDPTFGANVDTGSTAYTSGSRAGLAPGGLRVGAQKLIGLGVKVYRKGAAFSRGTKDQVKEANRQKNDGKLRSDQSGQEAQPGQQSKKGVTPAGNEANVDHVQPKSKGGDNSPENAQILTRDENLKKGDR